MPNLNAVEVEEEEAEAVQLGWEFEGMPVQASRVAPSSPGEFACVDANGEPLALRDGDIIAYQAEAIVVGVHFHAGYKGGLQVKPRKRIHVANTVEGSQQVIGVRRKAR